jgi:hypothetical protein
MQPHFSIRKRISLLSFAWRQRDQMSLRKIAQNTAQPVF